MKLKNIFSALLAVMALMVTSCDDKFEPLTNSNIKVSSSYVSIPVGTDAQVTNKEMMSTKITLTTTGDYTITGAPDWLTITPTSGAAGTTELTFSAQATNGGRNTEAVMIKTPGDSLRISVIQGIATVSEATCAEVIKGADGKTYRTKGVVTAIANTEYGNFYINDGTGEVYVYGTLYGGKEKNNPISNYGIEVGDEVTVEGPKSTYGTTVELVNVTVVKVSKSLLKCDSLTIDGIKSSELPLEGGDVTAHLTNKGGALNVEVPEDAASWLTIKSVKGSLVTFHAAANANGERSTTLTFTTVSGGKTYTAQADLVQKGAVVDCTVADFIAKEVSENQYRVTGVISSVANAEKGNFNLKDATGEIYVYKAKNLGSLKAGDIVTLVGKRGQYGSTIQMISGTVEASKVVNPISVADFRNLADDATKSQFYMLTGTVEKSTEDNTKWDIDTYGNFAINDGTGSVYVYGVTLGWGGAKGQFGTLGIKEGDKISIIAYKSSYKTLIEACGAMFFSKAE